MASRPESAGAPTSPARTPTSPNGPQLSELQSRFSRMTTSTPPSEAPSQGTTFAEKQAALRTASAFRKDPTSVSLTDARDAASTANNFRERHGEQVASGWKSANALNQKYGLAEKAGKYTSSGNRAGEVEVEGSADPRVDPRASPGIEMRDNTVALKKAPPPPPAKKNPELGGAVGGAATGAGPPPIPLSSKPKPNVSDG